MSCAARIKKCTKVHKDSIFSSTYYITQHQTQKMSSNNVPQQHKAAQILKANGDLTLVDRDTPKPKRNEVLVKVSASSICASDHFTQAGIMGSPYPMSPGHEVV